MRTPIAAMLLILASCASSSVYEPQIRETLSQYDKRIAAMDAQAISDLYTDDGQLRVSGPQGTVVVADGRERIRGLLQAMNGKYRVLHNSIDVSSIDVEHGVAFVTADFRQATEDLHAKRTIETSGLMDFELVAAPDGRWLISKSTATPR